MTLNQLRNVIAVADTGSMNEAAKQLYIAQPSLSQSVKELEKEIGAELFRRGNRGVILTVEGEEFLSYARQVIEQYELMENRYVEKKNVKKLEFKDASMEAGNQIRPSRAKGGSQKILSTPKRISR